MSTRSPSYPDLLRLVPPSAKTESRLYLDPTGSHQSVFDGVWWPHSRNPASELPSLILAIDAKLGQVSRVSLSATGWDERPRRVMVSGRAITVDYFGSQPSTLLTAVCARSRVDLLVISSTAGSQAAHAAAVTAMSTGNRVITARPSMSSGTSRAAQRVAADSPRLG
jgi:hypothetical protein